MFKNVASQKGWFFAYDSATNLPKAGDAANITAYASKDYGTVTVLGDTSATEGDATNAKGWYLFDLTQAETNADVLLLSAKSSTSGIVVLGGVYNTVPPKFTTLVIDAAGLADANAVKLGPTGAGTAQTARDIGTSVLVSSGTGTGQLDLSAGGIKIRSGIKKNTALSCFRFVMTLAGTSTPATGKTVVVKRGIDTGALATGTLGSVTEIGAGEYYTSFAAADLNGDCIMFQATEASCNTVFLPLLTDA